MSKVASNCPFYGIAFLNKSTGDDPPVLNDGFASDSDMTIPSAEMDSDSLLVAILAVFTGMVFKS